MESNFETRPSAAEAAAQLHQLASDRNALAKRARAPWGLMAAFGVLGAWYVAAAAFTNPGANYEAPAHSFLPLVVVFVVLVHLLKRETGIQLRSLGWRGWTAALGAVAACCVLFSVSLGLVSVGLHWAVALAALVAFILVTWLVGVAVRSATEELRRG
jgi:hypothetical protein